VGPEHVAGGDLGNAEVLLDEAGLSAFARTWATEQNDAHRFDS
jgi:hypothetical protein